MKWMHSHVLMHVKLKEMQGKALNRVKMYLSSYIGLLWEYADNVENRFQNIAIRTIPDL